MKILCRVLNIRKHKSVVFIDGYTSNSHIEQMLVDRKLFDSKKLKKGDCFAATAENFKNFKNIEMLKIKKFLWHNSCQYWETLSISQAETKGFEKYAQLNAKSAGKQLDIFNLKKDLIKELSSYLEAENFENIKCNVLEKQRTASAIPPFKTNTHFHNTSLYLRISPENQLKQSSAILLKSVYTIDNVFYNKNSDAKHSPETCTLEFVALDYSKQKILRFISKTSRIMNALCKKYNFVTDHPSTPEIIDYNDLENLGIKYQRRIPEFKNTILINAPTNNPFVKENKAVRTETRWYLNGSLTAHGYQDETNYHKIQEGLQKQLQNNKIDNADRMDYFKWGLPKSFSFGLGIDILIGRYLNLKHITLVSNPLGLNYTTPVLNSNVAKFSQKNGRD